MNFKLITESTLIGAAISIALGSLSYLISIIANLAINLGKTTEMPAILKSTIILLPPIIATIATVEFTYQHSDRQKLKNSLATLASLGFIWIIALIYLRSFVF